MQRRVASRERLRYVVGCRGCGRWRRTGRHPARRRRRRWQRRSLHHPWRRRSRCRSLTRGGQARRGIGRRLRQPRRPSGADRGRDRDRRGQRGDRPRQKAKARRKQAPGRGEADDPGRRQKDQAAGGAPMPRIVGPPQVAGPQATECQRSRYPSGHLAHVPSEPRAPRNIAGGTRPPTRPSQKKASTRSSRRRTRQICAAALRHPAVRANFD